MTDAVPNRTVPPRAGRGDLRRFATNDPEAEMDVMAEVASAEALGDQAEAVFRAFRAVRRRVLARPLGLTSLPGSHLELLNLVRRQPGIRTGEAARTLRLASTTVSTLAHHLAKAGLLERRRDASDRRGVQLFLAPAAAAELADWRDQRLGLLARALAALDPDDRAKIRAALPALGRLVTLVRQQAQR